MVVPSSWRPLERLLVCLLCVHAARGLDNGLALTPPMGWLSWERFTCNTDCDQYPDECIGSRLYKDMADRLVADGYAALGYQYVNVDDCWSDAERFGAFQVLLEDLNRFPDGIEALAGYMHSKKLKLGIYGDCGTATCAGYPGQLKSEQDLEDNYFENDAKSFFSWQIDSFKFDGCNLDPAKAESICPKMTLALNATGRPILVTCEWPFYMLREVYNNHNTKLQPKLELASQACNLWRYYEDVEDSWLSILNIINFTIKIQKTIVKYHGPGHWFDPDQLVVGNFGLSLDQARAQMAIWSIWSAPLFMSNDLRHIEPEMAALLKNTHLIEVNQDPMGVFGLMVAQTEDGQHQAFAKPVAPVRGGCPSFAIVYLNRNTLGNTRDISFKVRDLLVVLPISLAAQRYNKLSQASAEGEIKPMFCKQLLQDAMTKQPSDSTLLNRPLNQAPNEKIEEKRVDFEVVDLLGDEPAKSRVTLDGDLVLGVNPNGVRAVKLISII